MTVNNFIPSVWSARILANLLDAHVYGTVANRDYQGDITAMGDTVKINAIGAVTIGSYTKNTNISAVATLTDAQTTLTIDQAAYFNFQVDDIDRAQQTPKIMNEAMRQAAWGLRDNVDAYIAALHSDTPAANKLGSDASPRALGSLTAGSAAYDSMVDAMVLLDTNNAPKAGRWVVIPPWFHGVILKDSRFVANTESGNMRMENGMVGRMAGFDIYVSNNVTYTGSGSTASWRIMFGYPGTISLAEQVNSVEAYRPELRFADAVKGLLLYGAKVIRPATLVTLYAKTASS